MTVTAAQRRALEGVRDGEVCLGRWGELVYDGKEIHGNSLASCRKRGWVHIDPDLGNYGRLALTAEGALVLAGEEAGAECYIVGDCYSCGEPCPDPAPACPKSKRPCGHHCNCSWVHDECHWCGKTFG